MPRGVPANGQRRRSAETAVLPSPPTETAETVAADPAHIPARVETTSEVQDRTPETVPSPPAERELTPQERRIQELETQLAQMAGKKDVEPELELVAVPGDEGNIVIHFLEDGFTALGKVWYRGQELEFEPGSQAYKDTFDRRGRSWLDLRGDEFAQVERWGRIIFRNGPWPGKGYADAKEFESVLNADGKSKVAPPTEEELLAAQKAELKRRRAAPRLAPAV